MVDEDREEFTEEVMRQKRAERAKHDLNELVKDVEVDSEDGDDPGTGPSA